MDVEPQTGLNGAPSAFPHTFPPELVTWCGCTVFMRCEVLVPGEPVIEYALRIEEAMRGPGHVFVLGYTTGDSGYIPVAHMFAEGGYETQGAYTPDTEHQILEGILRLVDSIR